ncbi:MAG: hypothetical protein ACR2NX_08820 [Chthoniobacterales bacterium]
MRAPFLCLILLGLGALPAHAQVQEKKLIDRLLEPDMSLKNSAQNKQFKFNGAAPTTKRARTKSFYVAADRPREKKFTGIRIFGTTFFATKAARDNNTRAHLSTRSQFKTPQIPATTAACATSKNLSGTQKKYETRDFDGTRPFLVRGKSQKSLNAQNPPMTIDQVRELLNKNK